MTPYRPYKSDLVPNPPRLPINSQQGKIEYISIYIYQCIFVYLLLLYHEVKKIALSTSHLSFLYKIYIYLIYA